MRQGQHQQKRMRGRNNNNRKGPNPLNRSYESNGPDVKIRGNAAHIADKYVQLARDAQSSGDPVAAENYLQHAEHYYRIVAAAQPQFPQNQGFVRADDDSRDEDGDEDTGEIAANGYDGSQEQPRQQGGYPQNAPQPYTQNAESGQQNQPREQREPREPREPRQNQQNQEPGGLPAFITGGQDIGQQERGEGGGRNRRNRRFGRYGRNGAPGEQGGPEGQPSTSQEPDLAPGE